MDTAIPTRFRPANDVCYNSAWILVASTNINGSFTVAANGACYFGGQFGATVSSASGNNGTGSRQCFTYYLF